MRDGDLLSPSLSPSLNALSSPTSGVVCRKKLQLFLSFSHEMGDLSVEQALLEAL